MMMPDPKAVSRIRLIINPRAGHRKRRSLLRVLEAALLKLRIDYEICWTSYAGHGRELAAEAIDRGLAFVGVVGGDGSVNEVATAFAEAASKNVGTRLVIIPAGSGNGLARALNIPLSPRKAIELIHSGHIRWIDAGIANGRYFFSNAGVGFDALIARRFAGHTLRGILTYTWLTLASFQKYRAKKYTLILDGEILQERAFLVAVANGNQFGYAFKIAPHASPDDGWLEVCIIRPLNWASLAKLSIQALRGKLQDSEKQVRFFRAKQLTIQRKKIIKWMQVDGEPVDIRNLGQVEVRLLPRVLPVVVPGSE
ncbi:diacylglycerol/lipid kinase family protein [Thermoflavifilum thermophilum]|uniref:Lipid kinase, YegS/Rv2252/BmrU family n=1 Tax=Thermoflavifilum thermophilum TaxID=1393122 RepID=A0A1I7NC81_9BACT|nr:diacylglycerol kinase family protein [Thermoflavifilum thermophilum]SFV32156.1 lipid kinase, YegS/Rv2252/BmrU family [Thermoflavifilum thermophilum]